ncbi:MAG: DUF4177 domain-containing protein [Marinosulfonomonas sp.]|nr:DUF4177 domain-containing protein [Marinosulfonomonas sp.]
MSQYEYKVVPAPKKGLKGKGIKGTEDRFANALMTAMNELGAEGWEYQRSDTLPCEERSGIIGKSTTFQNMLVFRREVLVEAEMADTVEVEIAAVAAVAAVAPVAVAPETITQTHPPLLNGTAGTDHGNAPTLGPATDDAIKAKDPQADVAAQ